MSLELQCSEYNFVNSYSALVSFALHRPKIMGERARRNTFPVFLPISWYLLISAHYSQVQNEYQIHSGHRMV